MSPTAPLERAADRSPAGDHPDVQRTPKSLPVRTTALGLAGALFVLVGSLGAGGTVAHDPLLGSGPLSALRYGHGLTLATGLVYAGFGLLVWAWVRLGRGVLAHLVDARGVLLAAAAWIAPMLLAPPLFSRDVYSYLGQGLLALHGMDPYGVGPGELIGPIPENVHPTWQNTPAPYGPLFIGVAKGVLLMSGHQLIAGIVMMRLVLLAGLLLLVCVLPGLVRHLGGNLPLALWLSVASPMTVIHLVGGPHNDMLMIGLLAAGVLLALEHRPASGVVLVSLAMAIKATAGVALPFLVWIWAAQLEGSLWRRFARAVAPALGLFAIVFGACVAAAKVGFGWLPALSAPGLIVNYLSAPTGLGQALHALVSLVVDVHPAAFVDFGRTLGSLVLAAFITWQWWRARDGGPEAVRRAAIVLCAAALLSPTVLPWYVTWSVALACALPWTPRALSWAVGATVLFLVAYYPDGEEAMNNFPLMALGVAGALLAAESLVRFDPLGLRSRLPEREAFQAAERAGGR